jgi:hypothetical protein
VLNHAVPIHQTNLSDVGNNTSTISSLLDCRLK